MGGRWVDGFFRPLIFAKKMMTTTNMGRNIHENMRKSWKVIEPHEIHGVFCCWTFVATWWTNTTIERCNSWRLEGFFWWFCIWSIAYTLPKTTNRYPTSDGFANVSPLKYVHFWVSLYLCAFFWGKKVYIIYIYNYIILISSNLLSLQIFIAF